MCLLRLARNFEAAPQFCDGSRLCRKTLQRAGARARPEQAAGTHPGQRRAQRRYLPRHREIARRAAGNRLVSGPVRIRAARTRQSQPAGRSAQGGDEGYLEQPRQAPPGVPTVREATNPMLYRLLKEFEALTGVPVLINTSFNVKGEPIVETPRDAVICFLTTGIDNLVLHDTLVSKNAMHKVVAPLVKTYSDVAAVVMSSTQPA